MLPNHRAISILSAFSKIIEKLVSIRLVNYFNDNNMFSSSQFGFRSGLSTEDAVQKVVTSFYAAFDAGRPAVGVFLDLAKAFDTVDREKLYRILYHYGVRGTPLNWFKSYFSARKQCVSSYKGVRSAMRSAGCGVAQGSALGPILFLIYINDLPKYSIDSQFVIYANDTTVFFSSDDLDNTVNVIIIDLGGVSRWIFSNSLTVNLNKSQYILFSRRQMHLQNIELFVNNYKLKKVNEVKFLGLTLDENLVWRSHITSVVRKLSKFV